MADGEMAPAVKRIEGLKSIFIPCTSDTILLLLPYLYLHYGKTNQAFTLLSIFLATESDAIR